MAIKTDAPKPTPTPIPMIELLLEGGCVPDAPGGKVVSDVLREVELNARADVEVELDEEALEIADRPTVVTTLAGPKLKTDVWLLQQSLSPLQQQ